MRVRTESADRLRAFEAIGVEIEYMIVDRETLDVRPFAEKLLTTDSGAIENEIERGPIARSNELAAHVIELKTNGPAATLCGLVERFAAEIRHIDRLLETHGARLLPTGMHPWMDPARETRLWPHGDRAIYEAFDRIFDCRGHGWANVQSVHLNLPFADDEEFARVHSAVRAVLPLLPALAASSPYVEGAHRGAFDERLAAYWRNSSRVASVSGAIIPEPILTKSAYLGLLEGIYHDLEPFDPEATLRHEWINARGAIARFDRGAVEIRLLDAQECSRADLAIAHGVWHLVEMLARPGLVPTLAGLETQRLADLLRKTTAVGPLARVEDRAYLEALGLRRPLRAGEALEILLERCGALREDGGDAARCLRALLRRGCLASALVRALGGQPSRRRLRATYAELACCLRENELYDQP